MPISEELKEKAIAETLERLTEVTLADSTPDIGWYGLPLTKRNNMVRYHSVQVDLIFADDNTINSTDQILPENSLKMVHYTKGFDTEQSLQPVTHSQVSISYTSVAQSLTQAAKTHDQPLISMF